MLTTTLNLDTTRTNAGRTAVFATLTTGRKVLLGESDSIGCKRAILDVLTVNNRHVTALVRKLEAQERERQEAVDAAFLAADLAAERGDDSEADELWQQAAKLSAGR